MAVFPLQELKHDNIVALLDFQVGGIIICVGETLWSGCCRPEMRRNLLLQLRLTFQFYTEIVDIIIVRKVCFKSLSTKAYWKCDFKIHACFEQISSVCRE